MGNKEMGWGMNETRTLQSLINTQCWTLYLNWTEKKGKTNTTWLLKLFQCFGLLYTFFRLVRRLNKSFLYKFTLDNLNHAAWFKLSRVNLYRNDLKGNENYFKLTGSRFELSRVRVTEGKIIVDVRRKSSGNR